MFVYFALDSLKKNKPINSPTKREVRAWTEEEAQLKLSVAEESLKAAMILSKGNCSNLGKEELHPLSEPLLWFILCDFMHSRKILKA